MTVTKKSYFTEMMQRLKCFSVYYKKQILAIMVIIGMIVFFTQHVYASIITYTPVTDYDQATGLVKQACDMVDDIIGVSEDGTSTFQKTADNLNISITDTDISVGNTTIPGAGTVIHSVNTALTDISLTLLGLFFIIGLMNAYLHGQNYLEIFIKRLFVLMIGMVCVVKGFDIIMAVIALGSYITDMVVSNFDATSSAESVKAIKDSITTACYDVTPESDWSFSQLAAIIKAQCNGLGYILSLFIPKIAAQACRILIYVACWSRAITVVIMAAFAPIAFADISDGKTGFDNAIKIAKNVFAVVIQGAIICFAVGFCSLAQVSVITNMQDGQSLISNIPALLSLALAEAGVCMKSQSIAKEIIP